MFEWVRGLVEAGGYGGIFLLMVLENLFPPIPSELIMAAAGFHAGEPGATISLPGIIVVAVLGTLCGNLLWYELGRWLGVERFRPLVQRFGKWFAVEEEDLDRATDMLRRWGPFAICIGRMFPGVRTLISVPAGMVEIPRGVFYLWTALGSGVWLSFLAIAGYLLSALPEFTPPAARDRDVRSSLPTPEQAVRIAPKPKTPVEAEPRTPLPTTPAPANPGPATRSSQ